MPTFVDQTKIEVQAGKGGDGMVAFRHEKFVAKGGPAGGDGGRGGSIFFVADNGLRTLMDFRYRRKFKAGDGANGRIKSQSGRAAKNLYLKVPVGTTVYDFKTNEVIGDLVKNGQKLLVAEGGRGGRGNIHFVNSVHRAPELAENGFPGEDRTLRLELKMLADVGLIGFPSVGKSTLLSVVTKARPKIAAYSFTTLVPNLGMVILPDGHDFSIADLPGLIKGASHGVGLGYEFLRHVERTKVLLHLVSMDPNNGRDPFQDYATIRKEMQHYNSALLKKQEIIVPTQMDLTGAQTKLAKFKNSLKQHGLKKTVFPISSVTHRGLRSLLQTTAESVAKGQAQKVPVKQVAAGESKVYKFYPHLKKQNGPQFKVVRLEKHEFIVRGKKVESLVARINLDHQDGVLLLARKLKNLGVESALREHGAVNGDNVTIGKTNFEFVD